MRDRLALAAVLTGVVVLAACSKGGSGAAPSAAPATVPSPPPAVLTDAQKKALLASLPAAYQAADIDNGEAKFAICKSCHTTAEGGGPMTGPNLWGVFSRKAGTSPGFAYSAGLQALCVTWDAPTIDKWVTNPWGDGPRHQDDLPRHDRCQGSARSGGLSQDRDQPAAIAGALKPPERTISKSGNYFCVRACANHLI